MAAAAPALNAAPSVVKIVKTTAGDQLLRDGQPYFIKGAGGDGSKAALKAAGANSWRTWGRTTSQPLCLGSYAFTWGNKQDGTATWFGMLLPDGSRLGAVDALTRLWTGTRPPIPAPPLDSLTGPGTGRVDPNATIHATLTTAATR